MFVRILGALIIFWAFAVSASAQETPALYDVVGVRSDDVLNVRAGPGARHPIVGTLAYNQTGVEVLRAENGWGLINIGEVTGWASLRFLQFDEDGTIGNTPALGCFGTEPFWGLEIRQGQTADLRTPDSLDTERFGVGLFQRAWGPLEKYVLRGTDGSREISVVVARTYCDDGMSDREYGFDATVIMSGPEGRVLSGCCSLRQ